MYLYAFSLIVLVLLAPASNSPFLHHLFFPFLVRGLTECVYLSFLILCCLINRTASVYTSFFFLPKGGNFVSGIHTCEVFNHGMKDIMLSKACEKSISSECHNHCHFRDNIMENKDLGRCISNRPLKLADSIGWIFIFLLKKAYYKRTQSQGNDEIHQKSGKQWQIESIFISFDRVGKWSVW